MPWTCARCESINIDTDTICEVCDEPQQRSTRVGARAIAAGGWHSLAVTLDGTVVGWGDGSHRQLDKPADLNHVTSVAAGHFHSLALKTDGTVVPWGDNDYGQSNVPYGLSNVKAIAAGRHHSLALTDKGTVVAWGYNHSGQIDVPSDAYHNVSAIAAGGSFSLALKEDGIIVGWGNNHHGETSVISINRMTRHIPIAIAAGYSHCLALKSDRTVVAWGESNLGNTNLPTGLSNVTAIAAGHHHSLALTDEGTVMAWGNNISGQTNVPPDLSHVIAIGAGCNYSLALTTNGTIVGWGGAYSTGHLSIPEIFRNSPELNKADTPTPIHPYEIGITLYKSKNYTAAFTYFTKHIKLLRKSVTIHSLTPDIFLLANALFWVGCINYQRGEFDRALQVLSESLPLSRKLVAARGLPDDIRNLSELLYVIQKTALRI
jgi:alpha-tubulin suppressor-like RCC1 family protein